jgi:predicted nucleic acid-binding protein
MTFADLVAGDRIVLDANTFVYHFSQHPQYGAPCTDLLVRIARREVEGFVMTHVLTETAHRLMLLEASQHFGWPQTGVLRRLQKQPTLIQQLLAYRQSIEQVVQIGTHVLITGPGQVLAAADVSRQIGLLSNDALIVALMREHGLTNIASHDADFDRVPGIVRYAPA